MKFNNERDEYIHRDKQFFLTARTAAATALKLMTGSGHFTGIPVQPAASSTVGETDESH